MNHSSAPPIGNESSHDWTIEIWENREGHSPFAKWFNKLQDYEQGVVDTALTKVLKTYGKEITATEWGKSLGNGLYEFRVRRSLAALVNWGRDKGEQEVLPQRMSKTATLRIFCTFHGDRIVLLFQGYDKGRDPSEKRQQREINKARKYLREWNRDP